MENRNPLLECKLKSAWAYASIGDVDSTLQRLKEAKGYTSELGTKVPRVTLKSIEETAYRNAVGPELMFANTYAAIGNEGLTSYYLKRALRFAAKAGIEVPEDRLRAIKC